MRKTIPWRPIETMRAILGIQVCSLPTLINIFSRYLQYIFNDKKWTSEFYFITKCGLLQVTISHYSEVSSVINLFADFTQPTVTYTKRASVSMIGSIRFFDIYFSRVYYLHFYIISIRHMNYGILLRYLSSRNRYEIGSLYTDVLINRMFSVIVAL